MAQAARAERAQELSDKSTIFALSSGAPPAAIAVVRISGPRAFDALRALSGRLPPPRRATLVTLRERDEELDRCLALVFPQHASATGEDLVELHLHGGRATVARVFAALGALDGLAPAAPGAFTRRAFENGRLDLAEAEGLGDLLVAETEVQRRAALTGAGGALSRLVNGWADRLLALSARVEAQIDYAEEGDVDDDAAIAADMTALAAEMARALAAPQAERLRDGVRVAIAGPPNAGKSSLLNALVGRDAAIVTPIAGTTRDVIEAPVTLAGFPFLLIDLAGLRDETSDPIEAMGIARAREAMALADIVLWLDDDVTTAPANAVCIRARADLPDRRSEDGRLGVSAITGEGLDELLAKLAGRAAALLVRLDEIALNKRQRECVAAAQQALVVSDDELLVAEALRASRAALDCLIGRVSTEHMLDALFGQFCVGK